MIKSSSGGSSSSSKFAAREVSTIIVWMEEENVQEVKGERGAESLEYALEGDKLTPFMLVEWLKAKEERERETPIKLSSHSTSILKRCVLCESTLYIGEREREKLGIKFDDEV